MVYIYKTNVITKSGVKKLSSGLNRLASIKKWNFDLQDNDKVLRIEATGLDSEIVPRLLKSYGYDCVELL